MGEHDLPLGQSTVCMSQTQTEDIVILGEQDACR